VAGRIDAVSLLTFTLRRLVFASSSSSLPCPDRIVRVAKRVNPVTALLRGA
jgi:hypothetical protein